jgi:hypothetical protein
VVDFLSQDWLDAQRDATSGLTPAPDASALVQHVVTGAPAGNVAYYTRFDGGRIVDAAVGKPSADPDLTVTSAYADAVRMASGELELSAAYMQGRVKVEGDMRRLFGLLPATHRADFKAAVTQVGEKTEI